MRRAVAVLLTCATGAHSQERCAAAAPLEVGSEWEHYVRVAQTVGAVAAEPWSLRPFGPAQRRTLVPRDTGLPWARTRAAFARAYCRTSTTVFVLPPQTQVIYNSGFPYGHNDGPVWAGRGITAVAQGGVVASVGPLTITFAPIAFSAQNAAFPVQPTGLGGNGAFSDYRYRDHIDLPQRFGANSYTVFDPGNSGLRLDAVGLTTGISTGNQYFGPANDHPIILGNNAAGFPHLFAGTGRPLRVWKLGRVHGRVFWGRTEQTPYSPLADTTVAFLASGIVGVFQPRFLPGLEVGGARFFHVLQDRFHLSATELTRPFGALLKASRARQIGTEFGDEPAENQLASVFFRLVLPSDAVEVYGEYGREDHNWDLREFWLIPDHDAAYMLGLRKSWRRAAGVVSVRGELLNSRISHLTLTSDQAPWYIHSSVRQGHTHKGQVLGSVGTFGGGASVLAVDRYTPTGRVTLKWERVQFGQNQDAPDLFQNDVAHAWTVSTLRFGRGMNVTADMSGIYEINRHFRADVVGLRMAISVSPGTTAQRGNE